MTGGLVTEQIRLRGVVQGVGMRPTLWRLANSLGLKGEVRNDGNGVLMRVQGFEAQCNQLVETLVRNPPALARIDGIERHRLPIHSVIFSEFTILPSTEQGRQTGVVPDAATCPECLAEILDPDNRRYRYPFTNCTRCGPRLSIINRIPYDRNNTSMARFHQCPACRQEYENPADRRFHAQPNACPVCGPRLWMEDNRGAQLETSAGQDAIALAVEYLKSGSIIAIKGIGGFHLTCDASNPEAVRRLRHRKRRYQKPFALMARDCHVITRYAVLSDAERHLLQSPAAPIVILDTVEETAPQTLPDDVAPGQRTLGFMLPYSPLHHLLMQPFEHPLIMTSGNPGDEPQCIDNDAARRTLSDIADFFLFHDRDIITRSDDSVLRIMQSKPRTLRRGRGLAPLSIVLPTGLESGTKILAMGAELKNTFCLLQAGEAVLSQHIGDLESSTCLQDYRHNLALFRRLFDFTPELIVVDKHPNYLSTQLGRQLAAEEGIPVIAVQHHHAHIAAGMVDAGLSPDERVLGIALDGLGMGPNGDLWGGEFLEVGYGHYHRLAGLPAVAMPGGTQAMKEPWRNTLAHLLQLTDWTTLYQRYGSLDILRFLKQQPLHNLHIMIENNINSPRASSAGRLFDAVAGAIGICRERIRYEGQAAIELESLATPYLTAERESAYAFPFSGDGFSLQIFWSALLADLMQGVDAGAVAARFHQGFANGIVNGATTLLRSRGLDQVVLSGGVFQNRFLLEQVTTGLEQNGYRVHSASQTPLNDGGLALGQAVCGLAFDAH